MTLLVAFELVVATTFVLRLVGSLARRHERRLR